jgi:ABC-type spermidine/putrescine transport system, permease component II
MARFDSSLSLRLGKTLWKAGHILLLCVGGFWQVFMLAPLVIVVIVSFTSASYLLFPPPGYSLRWYAAVMELSWFWRSLGVSLTVAVVSTAIAVVLGTLAARALTRRKFPGHSVLEYVVLSPLLLPGVVLGFALFNVLVLLRLENLGLPNLIVAHTLITLPFVVRSVWSAMAGTDASLEEAAYSLGATPLKAFRYVVLPTAMPGILAGTILAFTYSFNDVTISIFLTSGSVTTLPVELMADLEYSANAAPAAISSLMIALMLFMFLLVIRIGGLRAFLER